MLGAAIAYNLKKWMNYPEQKRKTAVMGLIKAERSLYSLLLMLYCSVAPITTITKERFYQLLK